MGRGNPNPNPETRFKPGQSGNPGGKTSEQKKQELANAEKAVAIRAKMLDALANQFENMTDSQMLEHLDQHVLKMLKDSEDRGLGAPTQPITNPDGNLTPSVVHIVAEPVPEDDDSTD